MTLRPLLLPVVLLASLLVAADARAQWWHAWGRKCGMGWSDGYHSRTRRDVEADLHDGRACPTCQPMPSPVGGRTSWRVVTPMQ